MTVTADNKKRVVLPSAAPGDVFDVRFSAGGQVILTKMEPVTRKAKLVREAGTGLLLLSSDRPITWEETRKAMDEFP